MISKAMLMYVLYFSIAGMFSSFRTIMYEICEGSECKTGRRDSKCICMRDVISAGIRNDIFSFPLAIGEKS